MDVKTRHGTWMIMVMLMLMLTHGSACVVDVVVAVAECSVSNLEAVVMDFKVVSVDAESAEVDVAYIIEDAESAAVDDVATADDLGVAIMMVEDDKVYAEAPVSIEAVVVIDDAYGLASGLL
jgi:hypothetical protein